MTVRCSGSITMVSAGPTPTVCASACVLMNTANTLAAINARFIYASELGRIAQEPTFPAPHSSGCHLRSGSLSFFPYIGDMLWRNRRGRPLNAPAAFIHPCQPIVAKQPPIGPGWAHGLKNDGYRGTRPGFS